jgi:hypothetical protein
MEPKITAPSAPEVPAPELAAAEQPASSALPSSRRENRVQRVAFHARHELHHAILADVLNQPVDDRVTQLPVRHLPPLKPQRRLHLVAFLQKPDCLVAPRLEVVIVDRHGELHFLDDDHLLSLAGSAIALFFFVEEFPVILNAANGRNSRGRNFHQIKTALTGNLERLKRGEDAELLTVFVDHANFTGADTIVNTDELLRGTLIDGFFSCARVVPRGNLVYQPRCRFDAT